MQRRKFLIGLGSLAAGGAAALGTGAFDTAWADRTMTVDVAGDASAYLTLDPSISDYAQRTGGTLEIGLDGRLGQNGEGINDNAKTVIPNLFRVENSGTDQIQVYPTDGDDITGWDSAAGPVRFRVTENYQTGTVTPDTGEQWHGPDGDKSSGNPNDIVRLLDPGMDLYVHMIIDLRSSDNNIFNDDDYNFEGDEYDDGDIPGEFSLYADMSEDRDSPDE